MKINNRYSANAVNREKTMFMKARALDYMTHGLPVVNMMHSS
jgi:hypothetical protein